MRSLIPNFLSLNFHFQPWRAKYLPGSVQDLEGLFRIYLPRYQTCVMYPTYTYTYVDLSDAYMIYTFLLYVYAYI